MNRKSRSVGRRSSILKIDLGPQNDNTTYRSRVSSRRVSFAETCQVKEFPRESPRHFKHTPDDGEDNGNQEQTPAPKAVSITGLDTLLTGPIQPQPYQDVMECPIPDLSSTSFTFGVNNTVLDNVDMDMTGLDNNSMEIDFQPEPSIEIKSFLQSLKSVPSKSMETPIYASSRESVIYSDSHLGITVTPQLTQGRSPLESLAIQTSFNHPEKENMIPLTIVGSPEMLAADENEDTSPMLDARSFLSNFGSKFSKKESGLSSGNILKASNSSVIPSAERNTVLPSDAPQYLQTDDIADDVEETKCLGDIIVKNTDNDGAGRFTDATRYFEDEDDGMGVEVTKCIGGILNMKDQVNNEDTINKVSTIDTENLPVGDEFGTLPKNPLELITDNDNDKPFDEEATKYFGEKTVALEETKCLGGILGQDVKSISANSSVVHIVAQKSISPVTEDHVEEKCGEDKTQMLDDGIEETRCIGRILNSNETELADTEVEFADNVTKALPAGVELTRCVGGILGAQDSDSGEVASESSSKSADTVQSELDMTKETVCSVTGKESSPKDNFRSSTEIRMEYTTIPDVEEATKDLTTLKNRLSMFGAAANKSIRMEETKCVGNLLVSGGDTAVSTFMGTDNTVYMSEGMEETACIEVKTYNKEPATVNTVYNNDVTQMGFDGMEETQCLGNLKEVTKQLGVEVLGNTNKTVMEQCDVEETVCTGGILSKTYASVSNDEPVHEIAGKLADRSRLSPVLMDESCVQNSVESPKTEGIDIAQVKESPKDNDAEAADTTTDQQKKRRSSTGSSLRKQLLHMGSKVSSQSHTDWTMCNADSTTPLPDSTSRLSDGISVSSRADSTTQLLYANVTGAPISATQIFESCKLSGVTDSTEMLLASRPTEMSTDTGMDASLSQDILVQQGSQANMSVVLEPTGSLDGLLRHSSPELELGEEVGLDEVTMPEGMEALSEAMDTDVCSTTTSSSNDGSSDTRNITNINASLVSNKSFASSFAIPEGPLSLETLFTVTYRPSQNMATTNSRYSIVHAPKIDIEDMAEVLEAELCLKPLVDAKKKMRDCMKDKTDKNRVNIELLQETLEDTQPQLFQDCLQASKEEVMTISEEMKSLHSYCFKVAECTWKTQIKDMYSQATEHVMNTGSRRADEILSEIREDAAHIDELLSSLDNDLLDLEKTECLFDDLQEKEISLSREKEVNEEEIQRKSSQQQRLQVELEECVEQESVEDQRCNLRQSIAAHLSCVNWDLNQLEDEYMICSFCDGQLVLRIDHKPGATDREISKISLRSLLNKEGSRLYERVLHTMILSGVDTTSLQAQFPTLPHLPQIISEIARTVGEVERFCKDVKTVNMKHKLLYRDNSIIMELFSSKSLNYIKIALTFDLARPLSSAAKISTQVVLGDLRSEDLTRKMELVSPGHNYFSRLLESTGV